MQYCKGFHQNKSTIFINKKNEILFIRKRYFLSLLWNEKQVILWERYRPVINKNFHCFDS